MSPSVSPVYLPLSCLSALVFPENPDGTHLVATHCIVTPFLGKVHAVLSQLSPSLLHFPLFFDKELPSVAQYTLFM